MIFETIQKHNGVKIITISNPEIRQIAGRAGRYKVAPQNTNVDLGVRTEPKKLDAKSSNGNQEQPDAIYPAPLHSLDSRPPFDRHTIGLVTTLEEEDYDTVVRALETPAEPLATAGIMPPDDIIYRFCNYFPPGTPFSYMLMRLHEISQFSKGFHLCRLKDQTAIADAIHDVPNLDIQERLILVGAPVSVRDPRQARLIKTLATCIAEQRGGALLDLPGLDLEILDRKIQGKKTELSDLETLHKGLIMYMWLSFRFPGVFTTRPLANHAKELVEIAIERCLTRLNYRDRAAARRKLRKRAALTDLKDDLLEQEWLEKSEREGGVIKDKSDEEDGLSDDRDVGETSSIEEVTVTSDVGIDDEGEYPEEFDGEERDDEETMDSIIPDEEVEPELNREEKSSVNIPTHPERPKRDEARP